MFYMESFKFYDLFLDDADFMSEGEGYEYLYAVARYGLRGEEPSTFTYPVAEFAFRHAKKIIDADKGEDIIDADEGKDNT